MTYYSYYGYSSYNNYYSYNNYSYSNYYYYCKPKPPMQKYEFTAFTEDDIGNINCGSTFTMPSSASTCITVCDDDGKLSGDTCYNEHANDSSGQTATIEGANGEMGNGGQVYAERMFTLKGSDGKTYYLVEIEQEGSSDDYFAFCGDVPPAGVELKAVSVCNTYGVSYDKLGAGPKEPPNTDPNANDDEGKTCVTDKLAIDVLANDEDADGDTLTITEVNGESISEGGSVTLDSGVIVTLENGELCFDGSDAYMDLNLGESAVEQVSYTVDDGNGGTSSADVEVTFCGAAETLAEFGETLPDGEVCYQVGDDYLFGDPDGNDAYTLKLSDTGNPDYDGMTFTAAYCISAFAPLATGEDVDTAPVLKGTMFLANSAEGEACLSQAGYNGLAASEYIDNIEWLLNADLTSMDNGDGTGTNYTDAEVQGAIWGLTDNNPTQLNGGTYANVLEILDMALTTGEGFEAGVGDIVGAIIKPTDAEMANGNTQPFIVGVEWADCIC